MNLIIHDLGEEFTEIFEKKFDRVIDANGKYAFCLGCFGCWTRHPGECFMNDSLKDFGATIGKATNLVVISKNCYGSYSPEVKGVLERGIGASTFMTTMKDNETHHVSRYGEHNQIRVFAYGDFEGNEMESFEYVCKRTAKNYNYKISSFEIVEDVNVLKEIEP